MTWLLITSFLLFNLFLGVTQSQTSPSPSATAKSRDLLLVVNQGDQSMSIVDPAAGVQIAKVKTNEVRAHEVTASPDGRLAYLPIYGDSGVGKPGTNGGSVEIVDLDKQAIVGEIPVGAVRPHWVKFGPDGMLYVSAELDQAVDVLDPRQQKKVGSIPTGQPESHMVVMSRDGRRAYTANVDAGTVSVLDLETRKTIKVIHVAEVVQRISMSQDGALGLHLRPEASPAGRDRYDGQRGLQLDRFAGRRIRHRCHARWQMAAGDDADRQQVAVMDLSADESGAHRSSAPRIPCRFSCARRGLRLLHRRRKGRSAQPGKLEGRKADRDRPRRRWPGLG